MPDSLRQRTHTPLTPRLWRLWVALTLAVVFAVVGAIALFIGVLHLLNLQLPPKNIDDQKNVIEVVKASLGLAAGVGAVVALVVATRRQRVAEVESHRDDSRFFTERYSSAAEQLGHEKAAVRLAGVYAMGRLADDWQEQRQICIDVLCAYLRMPYLAEVRSAASPEPSLDATTTETNELKNPDLGEREVRFTIIRVIRDRLRPFAPVSWQGKEFDFTGATFDGGSFVGARFSGGKMDFSGAEFSGGTMDFSGAEFSGGRVFFRDARFSGGRMDFSGARFSDGMVNFHRARFSDGTVNFFGARFSGGRVYFHRAQFSGGTMDFSGAQFSGGTMDFTDAGFSGGRMDFSGARFSDGTVDFQGARFSRGTVNFRGAEFAGGTVNFRNPVYWSVPPVGLPSDPTPGLILPETSGIILPKQEESD